jgi:hypothetical protein
MVRAKSKEAMDNRFSACAESDTEGRNSIFNRIKTGFYNFKDKFKVNLKDKIMNSSLFKNNFGDIIKYEF